MGFIYRKHKLMYLFTYISESSCFGSYEHASNILCDPNSFCSLSDSAISCHCNTGYQGDAIKFGTGCVSEGLHLLNNFKRKVKVV